jgi:uncharacterized protein (DUF433 family)
MQQSGGKVNGALSDDEAEIEVGRCGGVKAPPATNAVGGNTPRSPVRSRPFGVPYLCYTPELPPEARDRAYASGQQRFVSWRRAVARNLKASGRSVPWPLVDSDAAGGQASSRAPGPSQVVARPTNHRARVGQAAEEGQGGWVSSASPGRAGERRVRDRLPSGGRLSHTGDQRGDPLIDWREHLTSDPKICGGQLCAKGTRVLVTVILDNLAEGLGREENLRSYPTLEPLHIDAALAYAAELAREESILPLRPA